MMAPAVSIGSKTESIVSSSSSSSVSSLSSASGNALSTLSKVELDRLIAENMTSVLKSLKKRKHAKKHARIRQAAAAAVEIATVEETNTMAGKDDKQPNDKGSLDQKNELNMARRRISPRKNNQANSSSACSKTVPPKHRLKELQPKMKEESSDGAQSDTRDEGNHQQPPTAEKNGKENKTINAFQLLMGARHKSIGSNSPGRDPEVAEIDADQQSVREEKAKRKLQLQQWAERKGSGKRKIQDDAEGDYIEHQLKKRSKRMKKLIENMATEDEQVMQEKAEHTEGVRKQNKPSTVGSNSRRSSQSKKDPEALPDEDSAGKGRAYTPVEKENTEVIEIDDSTSEEFLKQLSSPTKKKDSLLGYFAKVSPDGRKKGGTPPQTKPSNEAARKVAKPIGGVGVEPNGSTPPSELSSRPRRSCANRIKDYAAFERFSPEKVEQKKKNAPIVTPLKIINVQSPNAMKVVKSPSLRMFCSDDASTPGPIVTDRNGAEWPTTPKSVKLAPLFSRGKQQQPPIDPEKARARQLFLMSGIPEKMRQEMEKRTAYEEHVLNESPVFPLVSHVTQLENAVVRAGDLGRSCIKLRPAQTDSPPGRGAMKSRKIRFGLFTGCTVDDYEAALIRCVERDGLEDTGFDYELPEIENAKEIVRDYKLRYHHFPVFKCYKQFRSIYQDYQLVQQEERDGDGAKSELSVAQSGGKRKEGNGFKRQPSSASLDESIEIVEPTHHWRNGELLFTEKYKPQNTEQILVNYVPAKMLKRFLAPWQEDGSGPRRTTNTGGAMGQLYGDYFTGGVAPHDDEFENSNGSSCSSAFGGGTSEVCNHVVLVGPPGCGKTCNVYAVAKEMHFNVLEINASSRRKGKIILQELLEATQSHQVRQRTERSNSLDGLVARQKLGAVGGGGIKKGAGSLLNGGFSCLERRPSFSETNGNGSKKLSLILIEDADIVFEQDDGFLGAINQLVATSKRPIVLTTTNPACPHMARYMARNNVIRYVAPGIGNVAKFLSLLALVERIPIDQHDVGRLYAHNGKDMRKTMNEVQFFIQSGGDLVRSLTANGRADGSDREDEQNDGTEECADRAKSDCSVSKMNQHTTLYQLFTRNQNEEMVLRLPLAFDTLWCNMELVLREAKTSALAPLNQQKESPASKKKRVCTPKRQRRRETTTTTGATEPRVLPPEVVLCEELGFLYENISRAEAGWGVTQRNRVRYGRDLQDEQQQQQLANEMGHALVEGSWIDWFDRRRRMANGGGTGAKKKNSTDAGAEDKEDGAKAYDGLRMLEQEQRQTIASYIGVNGLRSRVTACDYEPLLRQICRTERERSSQERRGSRFYHYLRNFASTSGAGTVTLVNGTTTTTGGFSADHVDVLSYRFEEQRPQVPATEAPEEVEQ